ncbi:glycosyl hydrolase family 76-domain-containing protein [Tirmania nivea]|nr:glycosyl hydrolase family 76-domain-containing protein [Tirmania nivea]
MIPKSKSCGDIVEAVAEAKVKRVWWGVVENGKERTSISGNSNVIDSDDDGGAQDIIFTLEESDSEDYSALEEESVGTAAMSVYTQEGIAVARRIWGHFWSPEYKHFRTQGKTAETIGDWNGYTVWAYLIGLEAIFEAEKSAPGMFRTEIQEALLGMEQHWSPDHGAYCAWVYFKGNGDIYIDDNAQIAILLLLAHRLLPAPVGFPYRSYLERASQVVSFCLTGWDKANGGGIRWHVSTEGPPWTDRNACSTSLTAVAALELASVLRDGGVSNTDKQVRELVDWGRECVDWVWGELVSGNGNGNGLVLDGLVQKQKGGPWVREGPTYTYNTGHTITALVLLYDLLLPGDPYAPTIRLRASSLVISSIDRTKGLYDKTVPNLQQRYWWDNSFFVHLLVEGLVVWGMRFGSEDNFLWRQVRGEIQRQMDYVITYLRDKDDGLYWRNFRLYTISIEHLRVYIALTGDVERQPKFDAAEMRQDDQSMALPVAQRALVKTLLGCGGAGRSLCIAGRVL